MTSRNSSLLRLLPLLAFLIVLTPFAAAVEPASAPVLLGVPFPIGNAAPAPVPQSKPAVASNGEQALIVWIDNRAGLGREIWGARVGSDGELLDPNGFLISQRYWTNAMRDDVRVAWADGVYLVVWELEWREVRGVRVSPAGELLDPKPFSLIWQGFGGAPHLVSSHEQFLLAGAYFPLEMRIIDSAGTVVARPDHPHLLFNLRSLPVDRLRWPRLPGRDQASG